MKLPIRVVASALTTWVAALAPAGAAELVLERTAVDRLVRQALFTDQGRYTIQRGPCYAYLDDPSVSLSGGRVYLHARLASFLGVINAGRCVGVPIATKVTISGRPAHEGGVVRLADLQLENVADQSVRALLTSGLLPNVPMAIEIDVAAAVRDMLKQPNIPYTSELQRLDITSLVAEGDRLGVTFDFKLLAK